MIKSFCKGSGEVFHRYIMHISWLQRSCPTSSNSNMYILKLGGHHANFIGDGEHFQYSKRNILKGNDDLID